MNTQQPKTATEVKIHPALATDELLRRNAELRAESECLVQQNVNLARQLGDAKRGGQADRDARRAALNLMEDAVEARRVAQLQNTERIRAQFELQASEIKYRTLFDSIDEGFCIMEKIDSAPGAPLDFRFVEANPAFAAQSGVDGVVGKTIREAFPGESEEWFTTYDSVLASGQSLRFERELNTQKRVLELYAFRQDEARRRVAVIFKDISERKRAEEALREADRRKDEFLAMLAHELRNPLAPIRNSVHILQMNANKDATTERVCEMMERQVNHMVRLVDDLMEVSRISRGMIELRNEPTELATVIRSAVETSRPLIEANNHQLAITLPQEPVPLYGDVIRLSQVFANLLNNAAKYTDRGGQIWLNAKQVDSQVVVSIRDNGVGISPQMLPTVFDMFTQADRSANRAQGGLGIGLTLVKTLVEMHGGEITACSAGKGKGSEFIVRLPVATEAQTRLRPAFRAEPRECHAHRVLVVDDNTDAATTLAMLLKFLGNDVQLAHDGQTALELLQSYKPDIAFLDIGMPDMDGYELARKIREHADLAGVQLIALTGWGQDEDRERTRQAGFNHHLVKPADLATLRSVLSVNQPQAAPRG